MTSLDTNLNTSGITLCEFSKLDMCAGYLQNDAMPLDVDTYAYAQTGEVLEQFYVPSSLHLEWDSIQPVETMHYDGMQAVNQICSLSQFDSKTLINTLVQTSFHFRNTILNTSPLVFEMDENRIVKQPNNSETPVANPPQQNSSNAGHHSANSALTHHSAYLGGIGSSNDGGEDGNDPNFFNAILSGHYQELTDDIIMKLLELIFIFNPPQISYNYMRDSIPKFQQLRLSTERDGRAIGYGIDTKTYHPAYNRVSKNFVRLTSFQNNATRIYVRRGSNQFYELETRSVNIGAINQYFNGEVYSERSTSFGPSRSRSVSSASNQALPGSLPVPVPGPIVTINGVNANVQCSANLQSGNSPENPPVLSSGNYVLNFFSAVVLGLGLMQGIPYFLNRRHNQHNIQLRNIGIQRGGHDYYTLTRSQGFTVCNIGINTVPLSPQVSLPQISPETRRSEHYRTGIFEGLEQSYDNYAAVHPRHASRMRRVLNTYSHNSTNTSNLTYSASGNGHPIITVLFTLLLGCYNANTGTVDLIQLFNRLRRNTN